MELFTPAHNAGLNDATALFRAGIRDRDNIGRVESSAIYYILASSIGVQVHDEYLAKEMARRVRQRSIVGDATLHQSGSGDWWIIFTPAVL